MKPPVPVEIRRHTADQPWSYALLDQRQREIAARVRSAVAQGEAAQGALLLNELAPVITRGRRTEGADLLLSPELLKRAGIELYEVDRGGLGTYHGPGQWVVFAVDLLENLTGDRRGVRKAVEGLLEIALQVGRQYEPKAEIRSGAEMGVWTPRGKFAAVGVHIEQGVLLHGLAVNGFRTATSFQGLRPCGLDAPVDFLLAQGSGESPVTKDFEDLGSRLVNSALQHFWSGSQTLTQPGS